LASLQNAKQAREERNTKGEEKKGGKIVTRTGILVMPTHFVKGSKNTRGKGGFFPAAPGRGEGKFFVYPGNGRGRDYPLPGFFREYPVAHQLPESEKGERIPLREDVMFSRGNACSEPRKRKNIPFSQYRGVQSRGTKGNARLLRREVHGSR